jgi:hypothetical protein
MCRAVGMESVRSLDLLLLPSSIGLIDLIRIHKILDQNQDSLPTPVHEELLQSEDPQLHSDLSHDSSPHITDFPHQIDDSSFISDVSPCSQRKSSYSFRDEENSHRAPCSLSLVSKSVQRKLGFIDDNFSQWFVEVGP